MQQQEKRRAASRGEDRRTIPRLSDARISVSYRWIRMWVWIIFGLVAATAVFHLVNGARQGGAAFTFSMFIGGYLAMMAIALGNFGVAINFYLKNESVTNFIRLSEQQLTMWTSLGILSCLAAVGFMVWQI